MSEGSQSKTGLWGMTGYQWLVIFAAWLGWGFDVFDGLLFNYVAPNCVPTLLGIPLGTPEAKTATAQWVGILTALLLVGWAIGGILFGAVCDRLGRTKTLLITMLMYALGTALCAFAPNIWVLAFFRLVASLGIGGEWAAGASMVAEVVPEKRRVEAGALLYTSAPVGLFMAGGVTWLIQGVAMKSSPETAWRTVFLTGLVPAAVALLVRVFVKEPERWKSAGAPAKLSELFSPQTIKLTISGLAMALVALLMWWTTNAFIAVVTSGLADQHIATMRLANVAAVKEQFKVTASNYFNFGGLVGTLLTVPVAKRFGRKPMFAAYFVASAISIYCAFGLQMPPEQRLVMYLPTGLSVFGVFGSFTYYLPELFPTRLRATGAGFCYNTGRFVTAAGVFLVGSIAALGQGAFDAATKVLVWVSVVPIIGLLLMPLVVETKHQELAD